MQLALCDLPMMQINYYKMLFLLFFPFLVFADDGALLFHGNCITCHNETQSISAPSMREIRQNYLEVFSDKEDFVKYMSQFITTPDEELSIMKDKIKKYKLMPLLGYEKSVAQEISAYVYEKEF